MALGITTSALTLALALGPVLVGGCGRTTESAGVIPWDPALRIPEDSVAQASHAPASADPQRRLEVEVLDGHMSDDKDDLLLFTLRVSNPTGHDIALQPCPAYRMASENTSDGAKYFLNCAKAPTVTADSEVDFAMEMQSPLNGATNEIFWGFWEGVPDSGFAWLAAEAMSGKEITSRRANCALDPASFDVGHAPTRCP